MNTVACIFCRVPKFGHISDTVMDLLWLPGQQHILFKVFILICMFVYTLSIVVLSICFYISAIIYYLVENMYLWPIEVFWILSFQ